MNEELQQQAGAQPERAKEARQVDNPLELLKQGIDKLAAILNKHTHFATCS